MKLLDKQYEQVRTETKTDKARMTTLEVSVKEMRHEHSKMKDNERADNEIFSNQIAALKGDVVQLRAEKFLEDNLQEQMLTETKDTEKNMTELKANVEKWRQEHSKTKGNERKEKVKNRAEIKVLKEEVTQRKAQTVTLNHEQDTSGENNVLDHSLEERLKMMLTVSAMENL